VKDTRLFLNNIIVGRNPLQRPRLLLTLHAVSLAVGLVQAATTMSCVAEQPPRSANYEALQRRLGHGWNTWDTHSVLNQVLLPDGLSVRIGIQQNTGVAGEAFLADALIGRRGKDVEEVFPGPHSWDGSYTDLRLTWRGIKLRAQTAHDGDDLVILITPLQAAATGIPVPSVVFSAAYLWNRPGSISRLEHEIRATGPQHRVSIFAVCHEIPAVGVDVAGPYFAAALDSPAAISTGRPRTLAEAVKIVERQRMAYERSISSTGEDGAVLDAIETTIGWDTIYEPEGQRVVSPVSRVWSDSWGGYVLFDWDTFFAATLAAVGSKDLAYANAIEILRETTPAGFVPNFARAGGWKSFDRSEPPVGAITALGLYERFHDRWLLQDSFAPLLKWNRWWAQHRSEGAYLVWGSDSITMPYDPDDGSRGTHQGAVFESGLDNSPMYDRTIYDPKSGHLMIAEAGLMSLYVSDCEALAQIAKALGKTAEEKELTDRAALYRGSLQSLWDEKSGMFLNKDLHTGELDPHTSPTNFYPLLARAATPDQARRMVEERLLNSQEFGGQWVIPSTPRNDPAYSDQNYWRGRIWGPMNYLVYLGLRNYDLPGARAELAKKSLDLFLLEWKAKGHVHENYNGTTGDGDDVPNSDRFYHWGALLGLIHYQESLDPPASQAFIR
jgi:putative isomerase